MSSSGGLTYHLRALRFAKNYWQGHRKGTQKFLEAWNPKASALVLVGPSAGYSLPEEFLNRFTQIIAIEPDAIARLLFAARLKVKPTWKPGSLDFSQPVTKEQFPEACAFLFANVLGQVPIRNVPQFRANFMNFVNGHEWASYHDALSGEEFEFDTDESGHRKATLAQMKSWIYLKFTKKSTLEVTAHVAPDLFLEKDHLQYRYWQWQLTPKRSHLIEGVFKS